MARSRFLIFIVSLILFSISCYAFEPSNTNLVFDIANIEKLTGQIGQFDQDKKIYKITIPHDNLKILMSGMLVTSEMGLSSWVAFKKIDNQTSVNGDLILLQDQINPVMSVALNNGLQVTGLHNPYLWDSPRVMFMHIKGEGDELQLASAIGHVLKKIKETSNGGGDFPLGSLDFLRTTLDTHKIDVILGQKGQFKDDVYKIDFGNGVKATDAETNKVIALNTWAAFAGSDNEAVVNGTIALHEAELQKALMKLRNAQIYVLAIYQNMINEERDVVLINFWGVGNTQTLASTLRSVFFIAQNNNSSSLPVEEIFPALSTVNRVMEAETMPVQLSLYKNESCSYVKANESFTFLDAIRLINVDYTKQLGITLHTAFYLMEEIVSEKIAGFFNFLPTSSQILQSIEENARALPSAKNFLLKLSVVSNNNFDFLKSPLSNSVVAAGGTDEKIAVSESSTQSGFFESKETEREIFCPSASRILAKLSVGEKNNIEILSEQSSFSLSQPGIPGQIASPPASLHTTMKNERVFSLRGEFLGKLAILKNKVAIGFHTYVSKTTLSYKVRIKPAIHSALSTGIAGLYRYKDKFIIFYAPLLNSLAHFTTFILSETTNFTRSYVAGFWVSSGQSVGLLKNKVTHLAQFSANESIMLLSTMIKKTPNVGKLMAENNIKPLLLPSPISVNEPIASPSAMGSTLFSLPVILAITNNSLGKKTLPDNGLATAAFGAKNTKIVAAKTIEKGLPIAKNKETFLSEAVTKPLPASLPIPRHTGIKIAKSPQLLPHETSFSSKRQTLKS